MTSYIQEAAKSLVETLAKKNADYAPTDEFSNFRMAAEFAGLLPWDAMLIQIGIKYTRIMGLSKEGATPENESLKDSLRDLAGYALIAQAWLEGEDARINAAEEVGVYGLR